MEYTKTKFSISVTLCFLVAIFLSTAKFIMEIRPINKKERESSFIYIFLNIAFKVYYTLMVGLILFNIIYYKDIISKYKHYDYVIVFGSNINIDNSKNYIVNQRVDKAIQLANEDKNLRVVLTGAKVDNEFVEEAYYMKDYMVSRWIKRDRLFTDILSTNTNENIENALYIIKEDVIRRNRRDNFINAPFDRNRESFDARFLNIGFLSSEFHLTRISMLAKNKGVKRPYVISVNSLWYLLPYYYVRENLSLIKAMALSQLNSFDFVEDWLSYSLKNYGIEILYKILDISLMKKILKNNINNLIILSILIRMEFCNVVFIKDS